MADAGRVRHDAEPAFVLHSYPYRETSLIIEAFTRNWGRVALVARGARRPRSALRGVLLAFQPLLLSWGGKAELRTLHKAEWQGGLPQLQGRGLLCGFYLNELMLKLLAREDAHRKRCIDTYRADAARWQPMAAIMPTLLRRFERLLSGRLGYALTLDARCSRRSRAGRSRGIQLSLSAGTGPGAGKTRCVLRRRAGR